MKKLFFYMAAAAIALTSCSSEDVVEVNNGNAIDFRVAMGPGANSRGLETTTENIGKFYVSAILNGGGNYFSHELFTHMSDGHYECVGKDFAWPMNENTLDFYAYSYYTSGELESDHEKGILGNVTITSEKQEIAGFTPNSTIAKQIDLVTAKALNCNRANSSETVSLTFNHALSQIMVRARNGKGVYKYEVAGVKIANVISQGDFNMNKEEWSFAETPVKGSYVIEYNKPLTLGKGYDHEATDIMMSSENGTAMLIPQDISTYVWNKKVGEESNGGAYLAVKVKISMVETETKVYPKTGEYAWVAIPIDTNWEIGNKYVYTIDFTNGAGYDEETGEKVLDGEVTCTASVTTWKPEKSDEDPDGGNKESIKM